MHGHWGSSGSWGYQAYRWCRMGHILHGKTQIQYWTLLNWFKLNLGWQCRNNRANTWHFTAFKDSVFKQGTQTSWRHEQTSVTSVNTKQQQQLSSEPAEPPRIRQYPSCRLVFKLTFMILLSCCSLRLLRRPSCMSLHLLFATDEWNLAPCGILSHLQH